MLGKRKFTGPGRSGIGKRRFTPGPRSSVGVSGAGKGSVRYAGRDYVGFFNASASVEQVQFLGTANTGLNPVHNTAVFERIKEMCKGFAMYRFAKFNLIIKGYGGHNSGQFVVTYVNNDTKGGIISIPSIVTMKSTGNATSYRVDQNGMYRCKMDKEWYAMDTDAGTALANTSPGTAYVGTTISTGAAWDVWVDYVIELKDPVRITAIT